MKKRLLSFALVMTIMFSFSTAIYAGFGGGGDDTVVLIIDAPNFDK